MDKDVLKEQRKLAILLIIWRIPGAVTAFIAASSSRSVVVWMEFVENASILIPGVLLAVLSRKLGKDLKYRFNYGTGKVEAITALSCEMFDLAGIFCVVLFAVRKLSGTGDETEKSSLVFALIVSLIGVLIDFIILYHEKRLNETGHSKMLHTAYVSAQKEFAFDAITIATLILSIIFEERVWSGFISPVICLIIAVPFTVIVIHHLRGSISELVDMTLDEETQLHILKALSGFFNEYEEIGAVRSRINGPVKQIDIELSFSPQTSYAEIRELSEKMQDRLTGEIGKCNVNIVISDEMNVF